MSLVIKLNVSSNQDLPKVNPFDLTDMLGKPLLDKSKVVDMWSFGGSSESLKGIIRGTQSIAKGAASYSDDGVIIDTAYANRLDLGVAGDKNMTIVAHVTVMELSNVGLSMLAGNFSDATVINQKSGASIFINHNASGGNISNDGFVINTSNQIISQYGGGRLASDGAELKASDIVGKKITIAQSVSFDTVDRSEYLSYTSVDNRDYTNIIKTALQVHTLNNLCVGNAGFTSTTSAAIKLKVHSVLIYNSRSDINMIGNLQAAAMSISK